MKIIWLGRHYLLYDERIIWYWVVNKRDEIRSTFGRSLAQAMVQLCIQTAPIDYFDNNHLIFDQSVHVVLCTVFRG